MERFAKIVNGFKPWTILAKHSNLDVSKGSEYAFKAHLSWIRKLLNLETRVRLNTLLKLIYHRPENCWICRLELAKTWLILQYLTQSKIRFLFWNETVCLTNSDPSFCFYRLFLNIVKSNLDRWVFLSRRIVKSWIWK